MVEEKPCVAHTGTEENGGRKAAEPFCILWGNRQFAGDQQIRLRSEKITLQVAQQAWEERIYVLEEIPIASEKIPPPKATDYGEPVLYEVNVLMRSRVRK
jgi:hypothetical protein